MDLQIIFWKIEKCNDNWPLTRSNTLYRKKTEQISQLKLTTRFVVGKGGVTKASW